MRKGFTMIELVVVIVIVGILATVSVSMYTEYTRKAKSAEVPTALKVIAQMQIARKSNLSVDSYATALETLNWLTSNGTTAGKYYQFGTSGVEDCDPGTYDDPLPIGLAEAWALDMNEVLHDWRSVCMNIELDQLRNSF